MDFTFRTEPAAFLRRPNRFRVEARLADGLVIAAHCPDPGRLAELLLPDVTVHVSPAAVGTRKTGYDLRFVEHPQTGQLISLDSRLPNQLFREGLAQGFFPAFHGVQAVDAEVTVPGGGQTRHGVRSRLDYRLTLAGGQVCWVEVKSATLVVDGVARFPDAPTDRGRRHLAELAELAAAGQRAAVVFIVQRPDAVAVAANRATDPEFARVLDAVRTRGVEAYAATCALSTTTIRLANLIPVLRQGMT